MCDYFEQKSEDVRGVSRKQGIVLARHISMYLIKCRYSHLSLEQIAALFNGKKHPSISRSILSVEDQMRTSRKFRELINDIESTIQ